MGTRASFPGSKAVGA